MATDKLSSLALIHLATEIGELLLAKNRMLCLAESCTGGLASGLITKIPGSSAWFDSGLVVYSNQAKQDLLNVSAESLRQYGAASEQVAIEMAIGALNQGRANIAASVTGIAGPDGGSKEKPVGTVCFAWAGSDIASTTTTKHFSGNRQDVREQSILTLLNGIKEALN
jgi:nicotinamide-nucleotide amidase